MFFALGCHMINSGYTIDDYGKISSPSPSPAGSPGRRRHGAAFIKSAQRAVS